MRQRREDSTRRARATGAGRQAGSVATKRQASFFDSFDFRLFILLCFFAVAVVVVVVHLFQYQIIGKRNGHDLVKEGIASRENTITLTARRGTIYDRNGNVLAISEACRMLCCDPSQISHPYSTAEVIAAHLGGGTADYVEALEGDRSYSVIARYIDTDVARAVVEELNEKELFGVYSVSDSRRTYPYGAIGSQVIGVVGEDEKGSIKGKTGLELKYDSILKGTNGSMVLEEGLYGTPIADAEGVVVDEIIDGTDIVVSLDINIQRIAESQIVEGVKQYKADSGSVMVSDPRTGEILAACSTPLFDLSDMSVVEPGATSLRPVSDSYEPGSIFKIVTAGIALEKADVKDSTEFYVPAYYLVGNDYVTDDDGRAYDMNMTLREILRRSSNAGAALLAQEVIGQEDFAAGMKEFGIGSTTEIDYPGEVPGIVKEPSEYDGATLGSMGFGQALAIPVTQMMYATGIVANDGVPMPLHFLISSGMEKKEWKAGKRVMSKKNARLLTDMLCDVIEEGTGELAQVEGYRVAGKTGTAQQADLEKGGYALGSFSSSLIGYAPAEDPQVLVYVGLNGTDYHSYDSSAPLFSAIMSEALTDMAIMPTTSE